MENTIPLKCKLPVASCFLLDENHGKLHDSHQTLWQMRSMKISEVALIIIWHNYILSMTHPVQNQLILYSTRWKKMGILSLFREIFFELVISTLNGISEFSDLKKWLTLFWPFVNGNVKTACSFLEFVNKQTIARGTKYSGFLLCKVINRL